jgi:hypothetical protein
MAFLHHLDSAERGGGSEEDEGEEGRTLTLKFVLDIRYFFFYGDEAFYFLINKPMATVQSLPMYTYCTVQYSIKKNVRKCKK